MKKPLKRNIREDLVVQAALEAYGSIRHDGRLSDRALDSVLRSKKTLYSQERRAVAERVYGALRHQRLIDYLLEKAAPNASRLSTTEKDLLRLTIGRVLDGEVPADVASTAGHPLVDQRWLESLEGFRRGLSKLGKVERFGVEASLPDFLAEKFLREFGDDAPAEARAMNERGPLAVRANTLKLTREELADKLTREDVRSRPTPLSPFGLIVDTRINLFSLQSFKDGLFEIQDEGSQLLGMLVDAPPRRVFDACAGAGGKTLQLAAQMKNRGDLFALDVEQRRMDDLKKRARRAGVHNARVSLIPKDDPEASVVLAAWKDSAERVLVDAPCSGSGTYRRKPDARYKLDQAALDDHSARQKMLLARFATLVKPGGRLIYGTCSVLTEENEDVVKDFLGNHPDFEAADASKWLGAELGAKTTRGGFLRLSPGRHGTDGFFGAVLLRKAA